MKLLTTPTRRLRAALVFMLAATLVASLGGSAEAAEPGLGVTSSSIVRNGFLLTLIAMGPAIFISMTSFIRIAIVLSMVRHAFGMPETPPNAVLVSLAIILTGYVMAPTFSDSNANALRPMLAEEISVETALQRGAEPLRTFMLRQVREDDIAAIYDMSGAPLPDSANEVDILKLAPAFILNELRVSFTIGFVVLLPFLLIELVVASILLALGMMMVPPATISLPIKILMFILIDGWALVIQGVVGGFG
ncbi:MAG: flagellar type III secretion system pore protein FliP [Terricaulis sp.]